MKLLKLIGSVLMFLIHVAFTLFGLALNIFLSFIRIYAEPVTDPSAEAVTGVWRLDQVIADGEAMAPAELGIQSYMLTLSADGTFTLNNEGEEEVSLWHMEDGQVSLLLDTEDDFTPVSVGDGVMTVTAGGLTLRFVRETAEKQDETAGIPEGLSDRLDRTYVCVSASVSGYAMDVSALGRYDVNFGSSGTARLTVGGSVLPETEYTATDTGISCSYYSMEFDFEYTDTGFQMLYGGSMLLVYEAE